VVQVKKEEVRSAILKATYALFQEKGYNETSVSEIGRVAGVSPSNLYVYFGSKLDILFAIYDPWLRERLRALESELRTIDDPEARLRTIFGTLWRDIPAEDNGFANNMMQALSTGSVEEGYSRELLLWAEERVSAMILDCLPPERAAIAERSLLAHVVFMAFDGFAMNHKLRGPSRRIDDIIDLTVALVLGRPYEGGGT
jgi:AcrR family transcriptional regulator